MAERNTPKKKRLNADEKRALKAANLQRFVQYYGRKSQKGVEPNDRKYDEELVEIVRRMNPVELDDILRDDES